MVGMAMGRHNQLDLACFHPYSGEAPEERSAMVWETGVDHEGLPIAPYHEGVGQGAHGDTMNIHGLSYGNQPTWKSALREQHPPSSAAMTGLLR